MLRLFEAEPIEPVGRQAQRVQTFANSREAGSPEQFYGHLSLEGGQVQFNRLRRSGQIVHEQELVAAIPANVGEDFVIFRMKKRQSPASKRRLSFPPGNHLLHRMQERMGRLDRKSVV